MKQSRQLPLALVAGVGAITVAGFSLRATAQNGTTPSKKLKALYFASKDFSETNTPQGAIRKMEGNVVFTLDDTKLTTDKAIFNKATQVATSPGKVQLNDAYNTLTAQTGTAFYKTRDAQFRGNVVIVARPKQGNLNAPEGSSRRQFDSPVTIKSEKVDYNWRRRISVINSPLTLTMKDRTVVADRGTYDARTETVTLENNVRYSTTAGDKGQATKFVAVITEGKETYHAYGPVNGVVLVEEDDEQATSATPVTPTRPSSRPTGRPAPASSPATSPAPPTSTPASGTEGNNSDPGPAGTPGQPSPPTSNPGGGTTP